MAANPPLTSLVNDAVEDDSNSEMDYDSDATIPLSTPKYLDVYRSRMKNKNIDTNSEDEDEEDLDKVVSNGVMNEGMQIIVSDLQTARENMEQMKHGISVDLSGLIDPTPSNVECYILQSDYKDRAKRIRPKTKRVLLSIKNFPDDYSSLEKVKDIVECIATVVKNMNDNTLQIYINCRSGVNRSPLISARLMAYLTYNNTNEPGTLVYCCYRKLCYLYWKEILSSNMTSQEIPEDNTLKAQFASTSPDQWPKICIADWTQLQICTFGRREVKYPNNNLGIRIPKSIYVSTDVGGDIDGIVAEDDL